jgi:putative transposase
MNAFLDAALSGHDRPWLFHSLKTSPGMIRIAAMLHVRFPLSLRDVQDLLHGRGIDIRHETVGVF